MRAAAVKMRQTADLDAALNRLTETGRRRLSTRGIGAITTSAPRLRNRDRRNQDSFRNPAGRGLQRSLRIIVTLVVPARLVFSEPGTGWKPSRS